ncbi:hypothetical protein H0H93_004474 [Arthromyces matolae]|nr:hypothetical protein H0H93_004474 [Arthromyces matolae]
MIVASVAIPVLCPPSGLRFRNSHSIPAILRLANFAIYIPSCGTMIDLRSNKEQPSLLGGSSTSSILLRPDANAETLTLHFVLGLVFKDYGAFTAQFTEQLRSPPRSLHNNAIVNSSNALEVYEEPRSNHTDFTFGRRANATFVLLCRNSELEGVVSSIQQMEDRFNTHHNYPWVLLNEEPFTEEFKKCRLSSHIHWPTNLNIDRRVSVLTDAPISFGLIPKDHWFQPEWIDEDRARAGRAKMMWQGIIYAGQLKSFFEKRKGKLTGTVTCVASIPA